MPWIVRPFFLVTFLLNLVTAEDQCRTEVNILGMALKGFVFKRMQATALQKCDDKCAREITCQSYNYNIQEKICELNNRTKEARPENFHADPAWFYIRRLIDRGMHPVRGLNNYCLVLFGKALRNAVHSETK